MIWSFGGAHRSYRRIRLDFDEGGAVFLNETRNQHYISQAEQRLNAFNPSAAKRSRRIYEFRVVDRQRPELSLVNETGRLIKNSLSFDDLFSFDAEQDATFRSNLETVFQGYERDVATHSRVLLEKLRPGQARNTKDELLGLFAAKLLNMLRNPHCVTKVLNTVGKVADYRPTDPKLLVTFNRLLSGNRPRQSDICKNFGISTSAYERWLRVLFLLLTKPDNEPLNLFESTIKGMFESKRVMVHVYEYTRSDPNQVCLLSDRGFNTPIQSDSTFALEVNVSSRAFVRFVLCDPQVYAPEGTQSELADRARGRVSVTRFENDLEALARYNQLTAFQCASTVFAASPSPLLAA